MSAAAPPPYDEPATLDELVFALGRRDEPTVALVECASLAKRRELEAQLAERMPEYRYHVLDVTPYSVVSLLRTLEEELPAEIKASQPVQWVVHVHGLENSRLLSQDGQLVPSPLTAQLNLERERLFRSVPYLIVLWGDADFFRTLQREAPDFWHWVTYRFRFEDHTARPVSELPPLPLKSLPGPPGNAAERQARITELQERYDHLALDDSDKQRLMRDKINILGLLGEEYVADFRYEEAEKSFKMVIALQERLRVGDSARGAAYHWLGVIHLKQRRLSEALAACERCIPLAVGNNVSAVHHQMGMIYQELEQWEEALQQYRQSLEHQERIADVSQKGSTYHQIGILFQAQQLWPLALHNYRQALNWKQCAGDYFGLASTYGQIGAIYHKQQHWALALENYQQALNWEKRTSNGQPTGAVNYYIGRVYEEQQLYEEALPWFYEAVECCAKNGDPLLPNAEAALARIRLELQQASQAAGETSRPDETR